MANSNQLRCYQAFIQALSANLERTTVIENLRKVNISPNDTSGDPLEFNSEGERQTEPILVQVQHYDRQLFTAMPAQPGTGKANWLQF